MFTKHIGKHGDRKVAVVFRTVSDAESHMALVCYTETLNREYADALMRSIEGAPGQQSDNLAEVLHRDLGPDGRPILEMLHREGKLKKVNTNQIIMTPNPSSTIRLDELNSLLTQLQSGNDAVEKLAELDKNAGLVDPSIKRRAQEAMQTGANTLQNSADGLSDDAIASDLEAQASRMETEAKSLLEESKRLKAEAKQLRPKKTTRRKKTTADVSQ